MTIAPDGFHDHTEPTWFNQKFHARQLLKEKGYAAVLSHARVSLDNRHRCYECFCCALDAWPDRRCGHRHPAQRRRCREG